MLRNVYNQIESSDEGTLIQLSLQVLLLVQIRITLMSKKLSD